MVQKAKEQENAKSSENKVETITPTVTSILDGLNKTNPGNADIYLSEIEKRTGLDHATVIKEVRAYKGEGKLLVGRKGHKSRWTNKPQIKRNSPQKLVNHVVASSGSFGLQVQIGNTKSIIPINLELVRE